MFQQCNSNLATDYDVERISNSTLSDDVVAVVKLNLDVIEHNKHKLYIMDFCVDGLSLRACTPCCERVRKFAIMLHNNGAIIVHQAYNSSFYR